MRAIDSLYRRYGIYDGAAVGTPTMADVRDCLLDRKSKGREAGWMESAMRAVEVLCFGEMGHVLNSQNPLDIHLAVGTGKILALTEEGRQDLGLSPSPARREGGAVHAYWKRRLAEHLRSCGYEVTEEYPVGSGKAVDVVAERDGRRIAFEIETGESDAAANVKKCLDAGMDRVIITAVSPDVKRNFLSGLEWHTLAEMLTGAEATSRDW